MTRRSGLVLTGVADFVALLGTVLAPASPTYAADEDQVVSVDSEASGLERYEVKDAQGALICVAYTKGDYAHISNTPPKSASAHGWWINGNCNTTKARVTARLQIKRAGVWVNVTGSTGTSTVFSGGGAGDRATARIACRSNESYQWRSVVDVDPVGILDTPNTLKTAGRTLSCFA